MVSYGFNWCEMDFVHPQYGGVGSLAKPNGRQLKSWSSKHEELFKANRPDLTIWFSLGLFLVEVPKGDHIL